MSTLDVSKKTLKLGRRRSSDQCWNPPDMRTLNLKKCLAAIIAWDSGFALSLHGVADLACGEHTAWQMQRDA